jgi:[acyl-carrier-protein] S-malonyltransferase
LPQNGVTTLAEIGAGKVLTGLARRIDRSVTGLNVAGPADIDPFLAAISGGTNN